MNQLQQNIQKDEESIDNEMSRVKYHHKRHTDFFFTRTFCKFVVLKKRFENHLENKPDDEEEIFALIKKTIEEEKNEAKGQGEEFDACDDDKIEWSSMDFGTFERPLCGICGLQGDGFFKNGVLQEDVICDECSEKWVYEAEEHCYKRS